MVLANPTYAAHKISTFVSAPNMHKQSTGPFATQKVEYGAPTNSALFVSLRKEVDQGMVVVSASAQSMHESSVVFAR
jgi:hypothetical protein